MSAVPDFCPSLAKNSHVRFSHLGCPIMTCRELCRELYRELWHIRKCPLILRFCLTLLGNDALPWKRSDLFVMLVGRSRKQHETSDLPFEQLTPNNLRRFQTSFWMRSINSLKNIKKNSTSTRLLKPWGLTSFTQNLTKRIGAKNGCKSLCRAISPTNKRLHGDAERNTLGDLWVDKIAPGNKLFQNFYEFQAISTL